MNIIKYFLSVFTILVSSLVYAQSDDPVLIRIDDKTVITKSDFEYAYKKNLQNNPALEQSPAQFLNSYVNFLLNVKEAEKLGLNKDEKFVKEYSSFIEQIEKPYIEDTISTISLAKKIFERLNENIEVSHILIRIPQGNIYPKDTVSPYQKALNIRNLLIENNGTNFEDLALKYSEDSISRNSITPGYIGWKTSLASPLEFEEVMYNMPIGSISDIVRTDMGYHIIKVHNKRPDIGQINIAHILLRYPPFKEPTQAEKDSVATLAKNIYQELLQGADFAELGKKYSYDKKAAERGGGLGWYGVNRPLPRALEEIIFDLNENGDITPPIEVPYGYHIFKRIQKIPSIPWESMKDNLLKTITESDRKKMLTEAKTARLEKKYPYSVDYKVYSQLQNIANEYTPSDTLFYEKITPFEESIILNISNTKFNVKDFISYISTKPNTDYTLSTDILQNKLNDFILDRLIATDKNNLVNEYPEFRNLATEYYNGILYFNMMDDSVWNKARSDRSKLKSLFDKNPKKYAWSEPKYKGYVIHAKSKQTINKIKELAKQNKGSKNFNEVLVEALDKDTLKNIIIEKGLWAKGENPYVDKILYKTKSNHQIINYPEFTIEGKLISVPEELDDVYGDVTNEYQEIIEKERTEYLRKKYKVEIDQTVLESIK